MLKLLKINHLHKKIKEKKIKTKFINFNKKLKNYPQNNLMEYSLKTKYNKNVWLAYPGTSIDLSRSFSRLTKTCCTVWCDIGSWPNVFDLQSSSNVFNCFLYFTGWKFDRSPLFGQSGRKMSRQIICKMKYELLLWKIKQNLRLIWHTILFILRIT